MDESLKHFYESFAALKPLLPRDYLRQLSIELSELKHYEISRAFGGTLANREKLLQILSAAQKLAHKTRQEAEKVRKKTAKVIADKG